MSPYPFVENKYKVNREDVSTGKMFYIFYEGAFYQIMIGQSVAIENMFVNVAGKERHRIILEDLYSRVPDEWTGKVVKLSK